eukprot:TRINITY_DN15212_c0_g3_i1.p1 TRINITY_DN15212_c0_g3~~TRINITY_DN15212_c0_g3_i1.p1  ORF type:complete len:2409 (-),score=382.04 TRINITY_DN15212_c0_g3_i1:57-7187(-)
MADIANISWTSVTTLGETNESISTTVTPSENATGSTTDVAQVTNTCLNFKNLDREPPWPIASYPVDGVIDAPLGAESIQVVLYFNEAIQLAEAENAVVLFRDSFGRSLGEDRRLMLVGSHGLSAVVPASALVPGLPFFAVLPAGALLDRAGNSVGLSSWRFTCDDLVERFGVLPSTVTFSVKSRDDSLPTISMLPGAGSTTIQHFGVFALEFDEEARSGAGRVRILEMTDPWPPFRSAQRIVSDVSAASLPIVSRVRRGRRVSVTTISPMDHAEVSGGVIGVVGKDKGYLSPGKRYALQVTPDAFRYAVGKSFVGIPFAEFTVSVPLTKDVVSPFVVTADVGALGSPNPAFAEDTITLFFSEAVQTGTRGMVLLAGSDGGNFCGGDGSGACHSGDACDVACEYHRASSNRILVPLEIRGHVVVVGGGVMVLEPGRGYKLIVQEGAFRDVAGNPNILFDGETEDSGGCVLRSAFSDQSLSLMDLWPAFGAIGVPPSTSFIAVFSDAVQAGTSIDGGVLSVGRHGSPVTAERCLFGGSMLSCSATVGLLDKQPFVNVVETTHVAVTGALGQDAQQVSWKFTTLGKYMTAPYVLKDNTMARNGEIVSPYGLLIIVFNDIVKRNVGGGEGASGWAMLLDCSPGDPDRCFDGVEETVMDVAVSVVNVVGHAASDEGGDDQLRFYFVGNEVYVDHSDLQPATRFSFQFDAGAFTDLVGNLATPLGAGAGVEFTTSTVDTVEPLLYKQWPDAGSGLGGSIAGSEASVDGTNQVQIDDVPAPSTDIVLFFSEAVQVNHPALAVTINDGVTTSVIPTDNSLLAEGRIVVHGNRVTIDPSRDVTPGRVVEFSVPSGTFSDLAGNAFAGLRGANARFRSRVVSFVLRYIGNSGEDSDPSSGHGNGFPPRAGALLHHDGSRLVLLGGFGGSGARAHGCLDDRWTSSTGAEWTMSTWRENERRPLIGYSPVAVDNFGCIFLLGGACDADTGTLWKSCDAGLSWRALPQPISTPVSVGFDSLSVPTFPASFRGHALVIVGGWQLVIVDAAAPDGLGGVWIFLDRTMVPVQQVLSEPLPFGHRHEPTLLATSAASIYLIGGHTCGAFMFDPSEHKVCDDVAALRCANGRGVILGDVWLSADQGRTWSVQTASYAARFSHDRGPLHRMAAVITGDDGVFLMGGLRQNETIGSDDVLVSAPAKLDVVFDAKPYMQWPHEQPVPVPGGTMRYEIAFGESVQRGSGSIHVFEVGSHALSLKDSSGSADAFDTGVVDVYSPDPGDALEVPFSVAIDRQLVKIIPRHLRPGRAYRVELSEGSLRDLAGNILPADFPPYTFLADADEQPPTVKSMLPVGKDVPPWTTVTLVMSEPVRVGVGSLSVARIGHLVTLPVSAAVIVGTRVFFELPDSVRLDNFETYNVSGSVGLLQDLAGNDLAPFLAGNFTVASYVDRMPPTVSVTSPHIGQEDVSGELVVKLWFSEPVQVASGEITLKYLSGRASSITLPIDHPSVSVVGSRLAVRFGRGVLVAGSYIALEVSPGAVVDLVRGGEGGGNAFSGMTGSAFWFVASFSERLSPRLVGRLPRAEQMPTFNLPESTSLLLTFSETMQVGSTGASDSMVRLLPTYGRGPVIIPASSALYAAENVVLLPPRDLTPGEIYHVDIGSGAFMNRAGDFFIASGEGSGEDVYKISITPRINFTLADGIGTGYGHTSDARTSKVGRRYGAAATVGPGNVVYLVGGIPPHSVNNSNDSLCSLSQRHADVWSLSTGRISNCGSAPTPPGPCSLKACESSGALGNGITSLGVRTVSIAVWRAPGFGGRACPSVDSSFRSIGEVLQQRLEDCPCPVCSGVPNVNFSIMPTQLPLFVPASSNLPLLCETGFGPTGDFACVVVTPFFADFAEPFPACLELACASSPNTSDVAQFAEFIDDRCLTLKEETAVPHGESCRVRCQPGYFPQEDSFQCWRGDWNVPTCIIPPQCQALHANFEGATLEYIGSFTAEQSPLSLNSVARVTCAKGMLPVNHGDLSCKPTSQAVASAVEWQNASGSLVEGTMLCREIRCSWPMDPHGRYVSRSGIADEQSWTLFCYDGYSPTLKAEDAVAYCSPTETLSQPAVCEWTGGCNSSTLKETTTCPQWMHVGQTCAARCSGGLVPIGSIICLKKDIVGRTSCAVAGSPTQLVSTLSGRLAIQVVLPVTAVMESQAFSNMIRGALAESISVPTADFLSFSTSPFAALNTVGGGNDTAGTDQSGSFGVGLRRRLMAIEWLSIAYEVNINDMDLRRKVESSLASITEDGSATKQIFVGVLWGHGVRVRSIVATRQPEEFKYSLLLPEQAVRTEVLDAYDKLESGAAYRVDLVLAACVGGGLGITFIAVTGILFMLRRNIADNTEDSHLFETE